MIDLSSATHGLITTSALRASGATESAIRLACDDGSLTRIRRGWYASPTASPEFIRCIRVGGRATASTALGPSRLWVMPDERLHVAVPGSASRLHCPDDGASPWDPENHPDVVLHWNRFSWNEPIGSPIVSLPTALANLITSASHDVAMTTVDSALNLRVDRRHIFTREQLRRMLDELPAKYARVESAADGRAQSGLETLARVRLRRRNIRVRIQVRIKNVGTVDALIGDRFVLELDSREHHLGKNYENDRRRDLELIAQGFIVLRVSYHQVLNDWDSVERVILAVVRRGDHLRDARHRRLGLGMTAG